MAKFKRGDKVIHKVNGMSGKVVAVGSEMVAVRWDENSCRDTVYNREIKLAEEAGPNPEWAKIWEESSSDE